MGEANRKARRAQEAAAGQPEGMSRMLTKGALIAQGLTEQACDEAISLELRRATPQDMKRQLVEMWSAMAGILHGDAGCSIEILCNEMLISLSRDARRAMFRRVMVLNGYVDDPAKVLFIGGEP
jgi:hypothetical protein